VFKPEAIWEGY